jgi:hypothetical protein
MMRYIFIAALMFMGTFVTAQTDTLDNFFNASGATLLPSPNGGYLSGSNGYNDSEKLQSFFPVGTYSILGIISWNGKVVNQSNQTNSKVCFKVTTLDTSAVSTFPFFKGPTTTIDSVYLPIDQLQEGASFPMDMQFIPFANPVLVTSPYLIGFNLDSLYRNSEEELVDSFAVITTAIDSEFVTGYSWEKWNGLYKRIVDSWGLELDFALFPVIDTTLNHINKNITVKRILAYPNPTDRLVIIQCDKDNTYELAELYDLRGNLVWKQKISTYLSRHELEFNGVLTGVYSLRLSGNQSIGICPIMIR